ncbi:hypothetical protein KVR01_006901 [Diaporthe batatas]|uniref:uncharacterized protein n=1 Tax=Diaporthe batatas TaxID=748121 RepID=UPI001D04C32D|nr:uncharacterized protein KVR01_006901 [Diaporthe batatas]KAG8163604.1 hypothetical protein KVR01_006901 [Diaporthe batatas]
MCQVRTRQYEGCKHTFHQNEKPCNAFIVEIQQKAKQDPSAKSNLWCSRHASKIPQCGKVQPVNQGTIGKQSKPPLVPISHVRDPSEHDGIGMIGWRPPAACDIPRLVEGHCAGEELNFLREKPMLVKGKCGACQPTTGSGLWGRLSGS